MNAATQTLLDTLKAYENGLLPSISAVKATGTLDQISASLASTVSKSVPGAAQAIQVANGVLGAIASGTGPYSTLSRVAKDALTGNVLTTIPNVIKDLSGRTFQSDNYSGAVFYRYYVLGDAKCVNSNFVADGDVVNGLQWFINKTGVYISGQEHIIALQNSVQAYINLHAANAYTTTDVNRVTAAVAVMKQYMPVNAIGSVPAGSWANAVGVYDSLLVGLIVNSPAYNAALMAAKQTAVATGVIPSGIFGITISPVDYLFVAAIIILILLYLYL